MKIEIDYNGSLAACKVDGKPFNKCDVNEQVFAMEAFRTIIKDWNRESNIFQNGNISQCVECVWHSVDELPMFDRGKDGDMTPFIVDSYYGHIGGVAHSYTRVTWKNHIDTHRNRKFMWAYESDLFPINYKNRLSRVKIKRDIHLESQTQSSIGDIEI